MAFDQLALYNSALRHLGQRKLASLVENVEARRLLDDAWDADARRYCLEEGLWSFAVRSVEIGSDPDVTPSFGYKNAYSKPTDWVRTVALCSDEFFNSPITAYSDEGGFWYCSTEPLYVRYVSQDAAFGLDYGKWPATFSQWVAAYLATQICTPLTESEKRLADVRTLARRLLVDARSKDAMNGPTVFPAQGAWSGARGGRSMRDRGSRARLIG